MSNTTSITSSESKEAVLELTASALTTTAAVADATGVTPSSNGGGALIKSRDDQDIIEMTHFHDKMTNGVVDEEDIPSDIFDESLRYR